LKTTLTFKEIKFLIENNKEVKIQDTLGFTKIKNCFTKELEGKNLILNDKTNIKCSNTHNLLVNKDWISSSELKIGDFLTDKFGNKSKKIIKIENISKQKWIDFEVENKFESYIQNEVIHHNSGKSLIIYLFSMWMKKENKTNLIVVPSVGLVTQMFKDFSDYGMKNPEKYINQIGGDYSGTRDLSKFPITLTTWQSAQHFNEDSFKTVDSIIVDECHIVGKGDVLDSIIKYAKNSKWKVGMTGTVPRDQVSKFQLLGTLGPVKKVISARELIDSGLATDLTITCIYLKYSKSFIKEYISYFNNKPTYINEERFLIESEKRNTVISKLLVKIAKSQGNTIGLYSKTEQGENILKKVIQERTGNSNFEFLKKITPKVIKEANLLLEKDENKIFYYNKVIEKSDRIKIRRIIKINPEKFINNFKSLDSLNIGFYNGDVDSETREFLRLKIERIDKNNDIPMIIIANYGVMSKGINMKNLHNIAFLSSLKAFTTIVQALGRLLRKHESKTRANVFDFIDDLSYVNKRGNIKECYTIKHFYERLEYYREDEYKLKEKDILI